MQILRLYRQIESYYPPVLAELILTYMLPDIPEIRRDENRIAAMREYMLYVGPSSVINYLRFLYERKNAAFFPSLLTFVDDDIMNYEDLKELFTKNVKLSPAEYKELAERVIDNLAPQDIILLLDPSQDRYAIYTRGTIRKVLADTTPQRLTEKFLRSPVAGPFDVAIKQAMMSRLSQLLKILYEWAGLPIENL